MVLDRYFPEMKLIKIDGKLRLCLSEKELTLLIIAKFFSDLAKKIRERSANALDVSVYIKQLTDHSVDSTDYEFFTSILDLYEQFEKNCEFCFNLKSTFNPQKNKIISIDDLYRYREDPPDVIVRYKNNYFEFELKRYRDELTFDKLYNFVREKIIRHYSGKSNFLVILQSKPNSEISLEIFKKLHERLKEEKNQPGIIGFSFNNNNKEMILVRVLPKMDMTRRAYNNASEVFADILHSDLN